MCVCDTNHLKFDHAPSKGGASRSVTSPKGDSGKVSQNCHECDCTEFKSYPFGNKQKCSNCFHLHNWAAHEGSETVQADQKKSSLNEAQKTSIKLSVAKVHIHDVGGFLIALTHLHV